MGSVGKARIKKDNNIRREKNGRLDTKRMNFKTIVGEVEPDSPDESGGTNGRTQTRGRGTSTGAVNSWKLNVKQSFRILNQKRPKQKKGLRMALQRMNDQTKSEEGQGFANLWVS